MSGKRIPLVSSAYAGKSVISSGQECVNLYAETVADIDPQAPTPITYYLTPGTKLYAKNAEYIFPARGMYRTSRGTAYYVVGQNVYSVGIDGAITVIGIIADRPSQVKMKDNGLVILLVDGVNGYVIDMVSNNFATVIDPNFYGADFVELLDTFFVLNRPNTNQFYISASNANFAMLSTTGTFDPLDIAAKAGFNDPIVGITAVHRELQLIGNLTTEIWIGTGAADFYFQQVQGAFINHGCAAQYSIANQDVLTFFIQQDMQGNGLVVQLQGYEIKEISTPRIVEEFKNYATLDDAIGFCYQIEDHAFYELVFPTANKGWLYDLKTGQWSEKNWIDEKGKLLRPRENCCMFAFGKILVGDWESGNLLELSKDTFTDYANSNVATPIVRIRTFPHTVQDNSRQSISSFDVDMEPGTILDMEVEPLISIALSYDKGVSYSDPVYQSMGKTGEYLTVPSWNRLGQGRDIIIKLQWSAACDTALNGGFVTVKKART
jgi:hypothetical protein